MKAVMREAMRDAIVMVAGLAATTAQTLRDAGAVEGAAALEFFREGLLSTNAKVWGEVPSC